MPGSFEFGPFRYDPAQHVLLRGSEIVALTPKAVDLLHVLLERRGQVVDKAELLKLVWPDTVVEEIGLARNVSLLRKALGDDAEQYIETVPKRGYRFVLAGAPPPKSSRRWPYYAVAAVLVLGLVYWQFYLPSRYLPPGEVSLAVIPFEAASAAYAPDASGLSELLATELSKLPGVHVINPSVVRRFQKMAVPTGLMARLLNLQVVVEGTVQPGGRVTARLGDVHSSKLIWAESYAAGDAGDLARDIAVQVGAHLIIRSSFPEAFPKGK